MSEDPPLFAPGTEISAKFRGAFCEAKIKDVSRSIKCKVSYKDACLVVDESQIRGEIRVGTVVEFCHPETKENVSGAIQSVKDCSSYTVVFDDGDERVLRRTQICLKGKKHFEQCQTLNAVPLTNPEEFSSPVITDNIRKSGGVVSASDDDSSSSGSIDDDVHDEDSSTPAPPTPSARGSKSSAQASKTRPSKGPTSAPIPTAVGASKVQVPKVQAKVGDVVCILETSKGFKPSPSTVTSAALSSPASSMAAALRTSKASGGLSSSSTFSSSSASSWYPALVVDPKSQRNMRVNRSVAMLVRSFKDGRYHVVMKKWLKEFDVAAVKKLDLTSLKQAVNRAVAYVENGELPASWNRNTALGLTAKDANESSDNDDDDDEEEDEDDEMGEVSSEKRDRFVAQLYKFMEERGTPINKCPMIAGQDLDLYALYEAVKDLGGYARVCNKNLWKEVLEQMKYKKVHGATVQAVKSAFNRYLVSFEAFYRKLGYGLEDYSRQSAGGTKLMHRAEKAFRKELAKSRQSIDASTTSPAKAGKAQTTARRSNGKAAKTAGASSSPAESSAEKQTPRVKSSAAEEASSYAEQAKEGTGTATGPADASKLQEKSPASMGVGFKTAQLKAGMRVRVQYGTGSQRKFYEAKVLRIDPMKRCLVHYAGWNTRYDEVIPFSRIVSVLSDGSPEGNSAKASRSNSVSSTISAVAAPSIPHDTDNTVHSSTTSGTEPSSSATKVLLNPTGRSRQSSGGSVVSFPVVAEGQRRKRSLSKASETTKKSSPVTSPNLRRSSMPESTAEKATAKRRQERQKSCSSESDDSETRYVIMQVLKELTDRAEVEAALRNELPPPPPPPPPPPKSKPKPCVMDAQDRISSVVEAVVRKGVMRKEDEQEKKEAQERKRRRLSPKLIAPEPPAPVRAPQDIKEETTVSTEAAPMPPLMLPPSPIKEVKEEKMEIDETMEEQEEPKQEQKPEQEAVEQVKQDEAVEEQLPPIQACELLVRAENLEEQAVPVQSSISCPGGGAVTSADSSPCTSRRSSLKTDTEAELPSITVVAEEPPTKADTATEPEAEAMNVEQRPPPPPQPQEPEPEPKEEAETDANDVDPSLVLATLAAAREARLREAAVIMEEASSVVASLVSAAELMTRHAACEAEDKYDDYEDDDDNYDDDEEEEEEEDDDDDDEDQHHPHTMELTGRRHLFPGRRLRIRGRKRNYSYCSDYKKPTKMGKVDDSDNDLTAGVDAISPHHGSKDSVSLQMLRQQIMQDVFSSASYKPYYTFNIIDESLPSEKKVAIIEERLACIKRLYCKLRRELASIERCRRRKLGQRSE